MKVYQCISKVQSALAKSGIAKGRTCQQGASFKYRGIDEVYNALAPILSEHGLCILPRITSRECDERKSSKGGALFVVTVHAEFDLVAAEDGSKHTISTFGEAMDSGDKATNKAMSIAYKNAIFMAFSVPTEGDNDPDAKAHEVASREKLTEDEIEAYQMAMHRAPNEASLRDVFAAAYKCAKSINDTAALDALTAFYNARKSTIGAPA